MGKDSGIAWTDHTFNTHWGCQKVSEECANCYAEAWAKRCGRDVFGPEAPRRFFGDKHWREPFAWDAAASKEGKPARVFVDSMSDLFEDRRDLDACRSRLWSLIGATRNLLWLLLTKRAASVRGMVPGAWLEFWPANVWIGCTAGLQRTLHERWPHIEALPAPVKFISHEPGLGPIGVPPGASLIITGGESHGGRPYDLAWTRSIIRQGRQLGVSVFCKQLGANPYDSENPSFSIGRDRSHAGDLDCWPTELRVRQWP